MPAVRPAVVSFHFGLPCREQIEALRAAGIVLLVTATNLDEGNAIAAGKIDAVVAQALKRAVIAGSWIQMDRMITLAQWLSFDYW